MTPKELVRFEEKVRVSPMGCWGWMACQCSGGYGQLWSGGKMKMAHRVAYQHFVGSIAKDSQLDHLCRNHACVNPVHLEAVTARENLLRGVGACAKNARKMHCKRGHEFSKENTRIFRDKAGWHGRQCRACQRLHAQRCKLDAH